MKKQNKKGFTLVELVIVIAVIAILAGVMIGTFSSVVKNANKSSDLQEVKTYIDNLYYDYIADAKGEVPNCFVWSEESDSYTVVGFGVMPVDVKAADFTASAAAAGKLYYDANLAVLASEPNYTVAASTAAGTYTYYVVEYKDYVAAVADDPSTTDVDESKPATWTVVKTEKVVATVTAPTGGATENTVQKATTHCAPSVEVIGRKKTTLTLSFDEKGNYTVANKAD